ncbi:hypothetical protein [Absidia glauca]|uniref:Septin-type G domain-containing protein n=1 Tax=Absidia glauca TaxID=4829 RepID=A0A168MCB6_ABSGL|nr:hypothetical protein [Absidia glauca]
MAELIETQNTGLNSYVGFDTITQQIEKKSLKRGFQFNVMVVGNVNMDRQSGLGKSTLVNTLFASHLIESKGRLNADEPSRQTTEIEAVSHLIEENGVRLRLNIVDTPGYGDQVNNENCWEPIIKYIKDQHSAYLRKELTAQRERYIQDTRIHCCLFFVTPSGHSLKPIDIVVLQKLSEVVNVVPVIAKSDSLTLEEREAFRQRIKAELDFHNINLYPYASEEDDEQEQSLNESIRELIPFAVVGSERNVVIDGNAVRGRRTRWGVISVEDENHCEFVHLRNFLTRTHLQDLIETTAMIHYEAFRAKQLLAIKGSAQPSSATTPMASPSLTGNPGTPSTVASHTPSSARAAIDVVDIKANGRLSRTQLGDVVVGGSGCCLLLIDLVHQFLLHGTGTERPQLLATASRLVQGYQRLDRNGGRLASRVYPQGYRRRAREEEGGVTGNSARRARTKTVEGISMTALSNGLNRRIPNRRRMVPLMQGIVRVRSWTHYAWTDEGIWKRLKQWCPEDLVAAKISRNEMLALGLPFLAQAIIVFRNARSVGVAYGEMDQRKEVTNASVFTKEPEDLQTPIATIRLDYHYLSHKSISL